MVARPVWRVLLYPALATVCGVALGIVVLGTEVFVPRNTAFPTGVGCLVGTSVACDAEAAERILAVTKEQPAPGGAG